MTAIKSVRTKLYQWTGPTVPPQPHFCTNASDALFERGDAMGSFRFHQWLVCEVEAESGEIGLGNAALCPPLVKEAIDRYYAPLLIGEDPFDYAYLWEKMYRRTLAWGRKGVGMTAISAVDIAIWDLMGKLAGKPVFKLLGGRTKETPFPAYYSKLYADDIERHAGRGASLWLDQGFSRCSRSRFGYGPKDGHRGHPGEPQAGRGRGARGHRASDCDLMLEAYMGWNLDYAKRIIPKLESRSSRAGWKSPCSPTIFIGYAELNAGPDPDLGRRARVLAVSASGSCWMQKPCQRDPVRHQPGRRHHGGAEDQRAGRSLSGAGRASRRPDAQLSPDHGELQLSDERNGSRSSTSRSATSSSTTSSPATRRLSMRGISCSWTTPAAGAGHLTLT